MPNLIKSVKNCLIKSLKNRSLIKSKKAPYQKKYFIKKLKNALSENFKKYLIKNLKNDALSRNFNISLKRRLIKNLHKILYKKPHQESKKGALSRNLIKNLKGN